MSLNLVKYAGDFWVTLSEYSLTRDVKGYSDHASVKSAIRTFVVKTSPNKYIAFRGETQLKNLANENRENPMFSFSDFQGTRTALIHWDMLVILNERFAVSKDAAKDFSTFMEHAEEYIEDVTVDKEQHEETDSLLSSRSQMIRALRQDLVKLDKEIEVRQNNREKIMQAINSLESLQLEEA